MKSALLPLLAAAALLPQEISHDTAIQAGHGAHPEYTPMEAGVRLPPL